MDNNILLDPWFRWILLSHPFEKRVIYAFGKFQLIYEWCVVVVVVIYNGWNAANNFWHYDNDDTLNVTSRIHIFIVIPI